MKYLLSFLALLEKVLWHIQILWMLVGLVTTPIALLAIGGALFSPVFREWILHDPVSAAGILVLLIGQGLMSGFYFFVHRRLTMESRELRLSYMLIFFIGVSFNYGLTVVQLRESIGVARGVNKTFIFRDKVTGGGLDQIKFLTPLSYSENDKSFPKIRVSSSGTKPDGASYTTLSGIMAKDAQLKLEVQSEGYEVTTIVLQVGEELEDVFMTPSAH